jgi:CHASE2 domain-containing sensor protein
MKYSKSIWIAAVGVVGLIILWAPVSASAQGCALCYTQAASSGARMIQALKSGILILIAPPTFMSLGLYVVCYRKRNQTRNDSDEADSTWQTDESSKKFSQDW